MSGRSQKSKNEGGLLYQRLGRFTDWVKPMKSQEPFAAIPWLVVVELIPSQPSFYQLLVKAKELGLPSFEIFSYVR